jgi:hypothetical protein
MSAAPLALDGVLAEGGQGSLSSTLPLAPVLAAIGQAAPGGAPPGLEAAVRAALDEALKIDLGQVLRGGWAKATALQAALEATAADPAALAVVPLLDHSITSKHSPHIDVLGGGQTLCRLDFELVLTLALKGVTLDVRGGRIAAAGSGHAVAEATLKFLGQPMAKKTSKSFSLAGRLAFQPPTEGAS